MSATTVSELRLVVTAADFDAALHLYRDVLGMPEHDAVTSPGGRVAILDAGRATLEIADPAHAASIDELEVGRQGVAGHIRVALRVGDVDVATADITAAGAEQIRTTDAIALGLAQRPVRGCCGPATHPLRTVSLRASPSAACRARDTSPSLTVGPRQGLPSLWLTAVVRVVPRGEPPTTPGVMFCRRCHRGVRSGVWTVRQRRVMMKRAGLAEITGAGVRG
jgi:lactoylglutathione lyase